MAETAQSLFHKAEDALRAAKYPEALNAYIKVVEAAPRFWRARFRIGDTLLNLKAKERALEVYKGCALHAMQAGYPLESLVAIKMASYIDPSFHNGIATLAQLYGAGSARVQEGAEQPDAEVNAAITDDEQITGDELVTYAQQVACDFSAIDDYSGNIPPIPLFSSMDPDAFLAVLASLQLRRYVKGQAIVEEGKPGDSFFIVVSGTVVVSRLAGSPPKQVQVARLHHGAVFGEMALISRAPRTATVTAEEDCDVLELKRSALEQHAAKIDSVTRALHAFTHDRFLANLTATSAVFKPFPRAIRDEIIRKFKDFPVNVGDELIAEGDEGQGLFLIMKGEIEVAKKGDDGHRIRLATLKEGDVFGEISLIQNAPTTATCAAMSDGQLLFLPKTDFVATMARHPEMKSELSKITAERVQKTHAMLNPEEVMLVEDDDLVML